MRPGGRSFFNDFAWVLIFGPVSLAFQAIEEAIEQKLQRVEAGAQGEHKIQRGYLPNATYSLHYIREVGFEYAIQEYLGSEKRQMEEVE